MEELHIICAACPGFNIRVDIENLCATVANDNDDGTPITEGGSF